ETVKEIFEKAPELAFDASLYLFKSDDAKKHAVGIEKLKEIFSNPQHLSHSEARDVLGSANEFEKITKKLSKEQQDALRNLLNSKTAETAMPSTQVSGEGVHQQLMNVSLNPNGVIEDQNGPTNVAIPLISIPQAQVTQENQVDFTGVLNKIPGISKNLHTLLMDNLKSFSSGQQNVLFQHLVSKNLANGYALSQALESFKNEQSSLTQEEKTLLDTMAWNLNPQY
ncbi:MAG: hypothetical protein ACRC4G_02905, partial [Alphaproteobacteria bacterium]